MSRERCPVNALKAAFTGVCVLLFLLMPGQCRPASLLPALGHLAYAEINKFDFAQ
jgi:hypothetical protein